MFETLARVLIIIGISIVVIGAILLLFSKLGIAKLPGDIIIRRNNWTFFFPIITSIILSIILTIILNLFSRR